MKWLGYSLIYALVLSTASVVLFYRFDAPADAIRIAEATALGQAQSLAAPELGLPYDSRHHSAAAGVSRFALDFRYRHQDAQPWSLVIPAVRMNAVVYLNGQRIGDGGRVQPPVARNLRRPLIYVLPAGLLASGQNRLLLELIPGADRIAYLSEVFVGPDAALRAAYKVHYFVRITLVIIITAMIVLIGGTIGVLGSIRRKDREYAYFSFCTLLWALHSISYFTIEIPVSERLWDWLVFVTLGWFSVLGGVVYVHRYLGLYLPRIERPVLAAAALLSLLMLLLPEAYFYRFSYFVWHPLCQVAGTYGLLRIFGVAWGRRSLEVHIIAASGTVLVAYALHDLLLVFGVLDWGRGYIIQYSMPFILGLFCMVLLRRFVESIDTVERMNQTLEARVEARRVELEQTYARLRESEQQRLLAEERDRIMRDMHDGVGGHLVSTLTLMKSRPQDVAEMVDALQGALQDLRMMIDSLDSNAGDLPVLLGTFRSRIEASLRAGGIVLRWDVEAIEDLRSFGPQQALHVLRILQEFVTNSLRHARATTVSLSARGAGQADGGGVVIDVADDGIGIADAGTGTGRGLHNMRRRAAMIGADCQLHSDHTGTRLRLVLPR